MGYYQGDYYMGDPGFFSTLGNIAKSAVGFIPGVGPMLSKGIEAVTATRAVTRAAAPAAAGIAAGAAGGSLIKKAGAAVLKHPVLTGAGAAGIVGVAAGAGGEKLLSARGRKCKHINPRTGKCIRRMRATNVKALRRAIRRAHAFSRIAKKCMSFTERRPHRGRAYFKKASRRRV